MSDAKGRLFEKMARVTAAIDWIPKDGRNSFHKYDYATASAVYSVVRAAMAAEGLAVFASMTHVEQREVGNDGKSKTATLARFQFVIADGESGETMTCQWCGESVDSGDKGVNKAATAAMKYWLLATFLIPTGDDPDSDSPERSKPAAGTHRQAPPAQSGQWTAGQHSPAHKIGGGDLDAVPWTRDQASVDKFIAFAEKEWADMGNPTSGRAHTLNRLAHALGLPGANGGKIDAFRRNLAEHYAGSKADAAEAVRGYESPDAEQVPDWPAQ